MEESWPSAKRPFPLSPATTIQAILTPPNLTIAPLTGQDNWGTAGPNELSLVDYNNGTDTFRCYVTSSATMDTFNNFHSLSVAPGEALQVDLDFMYRSQVTGDYNKIDIQGAITAYSIAAFYIIDNGPGTLDIAIYPSGQLDSIHANVNLPTSDTTWHHLTYRIHANLATIILDGVEVASGPVTYDPWIVGIANIVLEVAQNANTLVFRQKALTVANGVH